MCSLRSDCAGAGSVRDGSIISAAFAGAISSAVVNSTLKRVRATLHQVGRSKTERADNVQGAFRVPGERRVDITGRRVMLVDDVLTSGATVDACARALLRAGAAHIGVLVFALVVAPARAPI